MVLVVSEHLDLYAKVCIVCIRILTFIFLGKEPKVFISFSKGCITQKKLRTIVLCGVLYLWSHL